MLTAQQLARLIYRPLTSTDAAALKQAYEHPLFHYQQQGLIARRPFGYRNRSGCDTVTQVYHLTAEGARFLAAVYADHGLTEPLRWNRETPLLSPIFPEHFLQVHDALIALESAGLRDGLARVGWADEELIKRVLKPKGLWRQSAEPDGYLHLSDGVTSLCALVEVDRGTEGLDTDAPNSWRGKTQRYLDLLRTVDRDPFFERHPDPIVLVICPSRRRLDNVRDVIARSGGGDAFFLATLDVLDAPDLFAERFIAPGQTSGRLLAEHLRQS